MSTETSPTAFCKAEEPEKYRVTSGVGYVIGLKAKAWPANATAHTATKDFNFMIKSFLIKSVVSICKYPPRATLVAGYSVAGNAA